MVLKKAVSSFFVQNLRETPVKKDKLNTSQITMTWILNREMFQAKKKDPRMSP